MSLMETGAEPEMARECPICRQALLERPPPADFRKQKLRCPKCGYTTNPTSMVMIVIYTIMGIAALAALSFFLSQQNL